MAANPKSNAERAGVDEESYLAIYQGVNMAQLGSIFGIDSRDLKEKLVGRVAPIGKRNNRDIFSIKECAPFLVMPAYDMDEFIQRMSVADLPTMLRKEFWAGMRSRQLFEKEAGESWPTSEVENAVVELFKTLRMSLLQTREAVEREAELTDRQRAIITKIIDTALEQAHGATTRRFTETKIGTPKIRVPDEEPSSEDL